MAQAGQRLPQGVLLVWNGFALVPGKGLLPLSGRELYLPDSQTVESPESTRFWMMSLRATPNLSPPVVCRTRGKIFPLEFTI